MTVKLSDVNEVLNRNVVQKIQNLIPECGKLQKAIPTLEKDGREFLYPVCLSYENGVTYGDDSDFSYEDPIVGSYDEIAVGSDPVVLNSKVNKKAYNRLTSEKAIERIMGQRMLNIKTSLAKRAEISAIYGKSGLATTATSGAVDNTGSITIPINAKFWSAAIWGGMKNAKFEIYDDATKINTNADMVLTVVDVANKRLTFSGNQTDIDAIEEDINTDNTALDIFFKGSKTKDMEGLHRQVTLTTGTIFGIDKAAESLFTGNTYSFSTSPSMTKILSGIALAVGKGGLAEDVCLYLSPTVFEALNGDEAALRSYDESYDPKKLEKGTSKLVYHGQNGKIIVEPHLFFKDGDALAIPKSVLKRVGSKEIEFTADTTVDGKAGPVLRQLESKGAYQILCEFDWTILVTDPAKCVWFTDAV